MLISRCSGSPQQRFDALELRFATDERGGPARKLGAIGLDRRERREAIRQPLDRELKDVFRLLQPSKVVASEVHHRLVGQ